MNILETSFAMRCWGYLKSLKLRILSHGLVDLTAHTQWDSNGYHIFPSEDKSQRNPVKLLSLCFCNVNFPEQQRFVTVE